MIELTDEPLDVKSVSGRLSVPDETGSLVVHFAVVKPFAEGKSTGGIRFTLTGDAEAELRRLESELREKWKLHDLLLLRRIGELRVGDVISVAAAAASGREAAFGACRDAVEGFKKMKGLAKEELFDDTAPAEEG